MVFSKYIRLYSEPIGFGTDRPVESKPAGEEYSSRRFVFLMASWAFWGITPVWIVRGRSVGRNRVMTCRAAKELHFNETGEALKKMQAGVDKLATVVGVTLGPKVCRTYHISLVHNSMSVAVFFSGTPQHTHLEKKLKK